MEHVRKMAVVPQAMIQGLLQAHRDERQLIEDSPIPHLSSLDQQLKSILENNRMPADIKAKEYNQVLQRYSSMRRNQFRKSTEPAPEEQQDLLQGLPIAFMAKAKMLIKNVTSNPDLEWNEKNEILYKGRIITGSKLVDLIHTFAKPGKQKAEGPPGWREFGQALLDSNVPRTYIANQHLLNQLEDPEEEENMFELLKPRGRPDARTPPTVRRNINPPSASPVAARTRRKVNVGDQSLAWEPWNSKRK